MDERRQTDETPKSDQPGGPDESLDESLAAVPPTPLLDQRALSVQDLLIHGGIALAAGAGALVLIAGTMTPTLGATRSIKLKWAERDRQIEQAERNAKSDTTKRG